MAAVDRFFEAWNAADNVELRDALHLPHVFLVGEGAVRVARTWEEIAVDFEAMTQREGWAKSTMDEAVATYVSADRVHLELVFSRLDADGKIYRTVPALWIMTRIDGRWGVQARSILGGPVAAVDAEGEANATQAANAFFTAWNTADNEVLRTRMNFPFVSMFGGRAIVAETPDDFSTDFDRMKRGQGWHHSTLDAVRVLRATPSKAHVETTFSRHNAAGERYSTGRMLYIFTRQNDHWGMQFRTSLGSAE